MTPAQLERLRDKLYRIVVELEEDANRLRAAGKPSDELRSVSRRLRDAAQSIGRN